MCKLYLIFKELNNYSNKTHKKYRQREKKKRNSVQFILVNMSVK